MGRVSSAKHCGVKICGLRDPENLCAAVEAGARFVGFVFYEPSPRHVRPDVAQKLAQMVPTGVRSVGLFVNPDDAYLNAILGGIQLDMIQLHGDESPARAAEIRARYGCEVMKAIRVSSSEDLAGIEDYEAVCDWLLFDAQPAECGQYGGAGEVFDWDILAGRRFSKPWMLAGGLTVDNVGDALARLSPDAVDVSSGVERARGEKDAEKIAAFIDAVRCV